MSLLGQSAVDHLVVSFGLFGDGSEETELSDGAVDRLLRRRLQEVERRYVLDADREHLEDKYS